MSRPRADSLPAIRSASSSSGQRSNARSHTMPPPRNEVDEMIVAVMGVTGSGKSTFINLLSKSNMPVSEGLKSCTSEVKVSKPFILSGRQVNLIDTPGFDDTTRPSTEILETIARFFADSYRRGRRLSGIIYFHRITDFRMSGSARRNLNMFLKLCGDTATKNVVIVTNMWSQVTPERGAAREEELRSSDFFGPLLDRGARMVRHDGTVKSAVEITRLFLDNQPRRLRIQRELVVEQKEIFETEAGIELDRELAAMATKYKREMDQLNEEMKTAIQEKDAETHKELEEFQHGLRKKLEQLETDRERMRRRQVEDLESTNRRIEDMQAKLQAEQSRRAQQEVEVKRREELLSASQPKHIRKPHRLPVRSKTMNTALETLESQSPSAPSTSQRGSLPGKSEVRPQKSAQSGSHHVTRAFQGLNPFMRLSSSPTKSQPRKPRQEIQPKR